MKALVLYSGGLDSTLACKLLQNQGVEVIALNFVSHFFGGKSKKIETNAAAAGIKVEYVDFKEEHRKMVEHPPNGYGKNMNPCIDCHAMMIRVAGSLLEKYDAQFIATGEVLGQRPMSQNFRALKKVEEISGMQGLIVRPLSAKCLGITIPEEKGWIDREKLMDIQGRTRKRQMELAEELNVTEYPSPGGGCSLTDPHYSRRLKIIKDDRQFDKLILFKLIKYGRLFRLGKGKYLIAGRDDFENKKIASEKEQGAIFVCGGKTMGPDLIVVGDNFTDAELAFAKDFTMQLFSRYSQAKGKIDCELIVNGEKVVLPPIDLEALQANIDKYLVK